MPTRNSVTDSGSLVKTVDVHVDVHDAAFGVYRFHGSALCRSVVIVTAGVLEKGR
jgi:hypothetical protein